ncbi:MAG: hypothetical protein ACYS9X_29015, partial [Planctomycetota bacterium]
QDPSDPELEIATTATVKATDAAGNSKSITDKVFWCPIIIDGRGPDKTTRIALQKGDTILVGVTPAPSVRPTWEWLWYWEDDGDFAGYEAPFGKASCRTAAGSNRTGPETLYFNEGKHDVMSLTYDRVGAAHPLEFDLFSYDSAGYRAIKYKADLNTDPDAKAEVTVFDIDLEAAKGDGAWYSETEEEDPGLVMGCDDDDDDGDGVVDSADGVVEFSRGSGEDKVDVTAAVLEDVVELRLNAIMAGEKVKTGNVKIKVYAPGAAKQFGGVRLMKRTDTGLAHCDGNEDTVPADYLPLSLELTYYLQGVTPSVRARDVAVVMEYGVWQHGSYDWSKTIRDVVWVSVLEMAWVNHRGEPSLSASVVAEQDDEPYERQPGQPGGVGGFGGPPVGTGFDFYQNPYRIENLQIDEINGTATCSMLSNLSATPTNALDGTNEFALNRLAPDSIGWSTDNGVLGMMFLSEPSGAAGSRKTLEALIVNPIFGSRQIKTLYETGLGTNAYMTRRLQLIATLDSLSPTSMDAELITNVPGPGGDTTTGPVALTATGPDVFENTDGSFRVVISRITIDGAGAVDDLTATVSSTLLDASDEAVDAIESAVDSLEFRTDLLTNNGDPLTGGNAAANIGQIYRIRVLGAKDGDHGKVYIDKEKPLEDIYKSGPQSKKAPGDTLRMRGGPCANKVALFLFREAGAGGIPEGVYSPVYGVMAQHKDAHRLTCAYAIPGTTVTAEVTTANGGTATTKITVLKIAFTNSAGDSRNGYYLGDDDIFVTVHDPFANQSSTVQETIKVTVRDEPGGSGDSEDITLHETGVDTGVFVNPADPDGSGFGLCNDNIPWETLAGEPPVLTTDDGHTVVVEYTNHAGHTFTDT